MFCLEKLSPDRIDDWTSPYSNDLLDIFVDIPEKFSVVKSFINFKDKIIYIFGFKVKIKQL